MAFSTASSPPFSKKFVPSWVTATQSAQVIGDGAMLLSVHGICGVLDSLAILLVELPHLRELAVVGTIVGDELSGHSDGLGAIDLEIGAWTEEVVRAEPVWLDIATVLVAQTAEAILTIVAAVNTLAASLLAGRAGVHGVGHGHLVCLPDVDLVQQLPYLPVPAFTSVSLGTQPSMLASPLMNFKS